MKQVCETCGVVGRKQLLVPCAKCHTAYNHCYCMQKLSLTTAVHFTCDECSTLDTKNKKKVRFESSNPVATWPKIPETTKTKLISPKEATKLSSRDKKVTFKIPKPIRHRSTIGPRKLALPVPKPMNVTSKVVARNTKPSLGPRAMQILAGAKRKDSQALEVVEGSKLKVGDGITYYGFGKISLSILSEKMFQILPYRPALQPVWKGCIMDSATPSEFSGEFLVLPASTIRLKAYTLSKAIPTLLKIQLVPIHNILKDLFVKRAPELSDIEIYIFHDDKNTKKIREGHDRLFEYMWARNVMIRHNINETPLLIFSSRLLDRSSQIFIAMQKKSHNFLWGIFILPKKSLALDPGPSNQTTVRLETTIKPQIKHTNHLDSEKDLQRN